MDKQQRIPLTPKKQKRAAALALLLIAALFLVASLQTQYTPVEFLLNTENFWSFIFVDLLPPKIADWETIGMGVLHTTAMAMVASLVSAVISLVLAFLRSNTTAPWKPLKKIIRAFASLQRNIPSMIWTFLLIMSFGIGTVVAVVLIAGLGYLLFRRNKYDENTLTFSVAAAAARK